MLPFDVLAGRGIALREFIEVEFDRYPIPLPFDLDTAKYSSETKAERGGTVCYGKLTFQTGAEQPSDPQLERMIHSGRYLIRVRSLDESEFIIPNTAIKSCVSSEKEGAVSYTVSLAGRYISARLEQAE